MEDTTTYRTRLEEEKQTLERELATVARRNPSNPSDWEPTPGDTGQESDPADQAEHRDSYEERTAIVKELEISFNRVEAALARIEAGTYGVCAVSGEPIEKERLDADPAATTCKAHL